MKSKLYMFLAAFLIVMLVHGAPAKATNCTITNLPGTGTLTSTMLNSRYTQIQTCVNGNLGNGNWNSSEPLAVTNLANQNATYATSFTIADEDGDATAGEDIAATTNIKKWRLPATATVTGVSMGLRCPSDVTGTPGDCAAASVTLVVQKDSTTITTFSGIATDAVQLTTGLSSSVTSAQIMNLDVSGTLTDVDFIDVVVYYKQQHVP